MAKYHSKFEKTVEKKVGLDKNDSFKLPYVTEHTYTPDFVDEETKTIIESKGYFDAKARSKMIAVKKQNPGWKIVLVFQNPNNKISKKSKTTYAEWAKKNGFDWKKV